MPRSTGIGISSQDDALFFDWSHEAELPPLSGHRSPTGFSKVGPWHG